VVSVARRAGKRKRRGFRLVLVVLPGGYEDGERDDRLLAFGCRASVRWRCAQRRRACWPGGAWTVASRCRRFAATNQIRLRGAFLTSPEAPIWKTRSAPRPSRRGSEICGAQRPDASLTAVPEVRPPRRRSRCAPCYGFPAGGQAPAPPRRFGSQTGASRLSFAGGCAFHASDHAVDDGIPRLLSEFGDGVVERGKVSVDGCA